MERDSNLEHMIGRFGYNLNDAIADVAEVSAHSRLSILNEASSSYLAQGDIEAVKTLHAAASVAGVEARVAYGEVNRKNVELEKMAITDPLTDTLNRRGFYEKAEAVYLVEKRNDSPMSVLMIDGDFFKNVNDTYGHKVGDDVLESLGETFKGVARESDIVARWGGEEFVLFLPNTNLEGAANIGSKINYEINSRSLLPDGKKFTVSIGAAELEKSLEQPNVVINKSINVADSALYWMKETGGRDGTAYFTEDGFKKAI